MSLWAGKSDRGGEQTGVISVGEKIELLSVASLARLVPQLAALLFNAIDRAIKKNLYSSGSQLST